MDFKEIRSALRDLIERSKDAEKGYREISNDSSSPAIRKIAYNLSKMRGTLTSELEMALSYYGGNPDEVSSSFLGTMHRAWIDLKLTATSNEVAPAIDEIERGEKRAIEDYERIIENVEMNNNTRVVLSKHINFIKNTLDELIEMKEEVESMV